MEPFNKKWDGLVSMYAFDVYGIDALDDYPDLQIKLFTQIGIIFKSLKKLNRTRFFKQREFDVTWLLVRNEIYFLNDISIEGNCVNEVYDIIVELFNQLISICEEYSTYECAGNLLKFRDYWFSAFNIKLKKVNGSK